MGLRIISSNGVEALGSALGKVLKAEREGRDPFAFSRIAVPNPNIGKWLQMRVFAGDPTLGAGLEFPFLEEVLATAMIDVLGSGVRLLPPGSYVRAIARILLKDDDPALECFRVYIRNGIGDGPLVTSRQEAKKTWQLAERLADLMDTYEVHRPELVENWLSEKKPEANGSNEAAEAALARKLWGEDGVFKPSGNQLSLRQMFRRVVKEGREPLEKTSACLLFGLSTLSGLQAEILFWMARRTEVVLFHNNVCVDYWGDISKPEVRSRLGTRDREPQDEGNPLLQKWGLAGRETIRILQDLESRASEKVPVTWDRAAIRTSPGTGVLQCVQKAIVCNQAKLDGDLQQDASIQVVAAPGPRREVETVYNSIMAYAEKGGSFSDVAVLVPDMATYRPYIEMVFDARHGVPYGLIDTTASDDSQYLTGFSAMAELVRRGLSRDPLFGFLDNPCVQRALGFGPEEVVQWRAWADELGAFDGFGESNFSWATALRRLRLAAVAEGGLDVPLVDIGRESFKFSEVVELIERQIEDLGGGKPGMRLSCCEWARKLYRMMETFLAVGKDEPLENAVRQNIRKTLESLRDVEDAQTIELVVAAVEQFVGGLPCRHGGYLTHGVTIAGLQPMRPVPFKQVYVIGLGAGGFPGRTDESTLDLRGLGIGLHDVTPPERNRYLMLETLMSVTERMVITYPSLDIEKDEQKYPSSVIRDLEDFIVPSHEFKEVKIPLLERDARCIDGAEEQHEQGLLKTYSPSARQIAAIQAVYAQGGSVMEKVPAPRDANPSAGEARVPETVKLTVRELAEFVKSPMQAVMRFRLGIAQAGYRDKSLDPESPLGLPSGPQLWDFQTRMLDPEFAEQFDATYDDLSWRGKAPARGQVLGDFSRQQLKEQLDGIDESVRSFVAGYALADGIENILHVHYSVKAESGVTVEVDGEIPNWKFDAATGEQVVLTTGGLGSDKKALAIPVDRTLEPFIGCLMKAVAEGHRVKIRVGDVDVQKGKFAVWQWEFEPVNAAEYIKSVVEDYLDYLRDSTAGMVDFSYRKLSSAVEKIPPQKEWGKILVSLGEKDYSQGNGEFDRSLVIGETLTDVCCLPGSEEKLKELYDRRYALPMSGTLQGDPVREGGVK